MDQGRIHKNTRKKGLVCENDVNESDNLNFKPKFFFMNSCIKLTRLIIVLTSLIVFPSCGQNKGNEPAINSKDSSVQLKDLSDQSKDFSDQEIATKIDTTLFHIDTIIKSVNFNGKRYALLITKDKYDENKKSTYDENEQGYVSPVSAHFFDYTTAKIIKSEKFSENTFDRFNQFSSQDTKAANTFLSLSDRAGGSGYTGNLYKISMGDSFQFKNVFDFNALSYFIFSKEGGRVIKLDAVWNSDEGETHFSDHRYNIYDYSITDPVQSKLLGKTKQKYPGGDEEKSVKEILDDIKAKEPDLLKNVALSDFVFE